MITNVLPRFYESQCILVMRVCVCVCPSPHAHATAQIRM